MTANGVRHFLDLTDIPKPVLGGLIDRAAPSRPSARAAFARRRWPEKRWPWCSTSRRRAHGSLSTLPCVKLGGEAILLTAQEMQLGRGETLADTARVLSRYVDAIMIRILDHEAVAELARHATIPVINGLTRRSHPCQVLADVMTYEEKRGSIRGRTVAWTGDSNNVLASWMHAAERFDFQLRVATPDRVAAEEMADGLGQIIGRRDHDRRRSRRCRQRCRLRGYRYLGVDGRP